MIEREGMHFHRTIFIHQSRLYNWMENNFISEMLAEVVKHWAKDSLDVCRSKEMEWRRTSEQAECRDESWQAEAMVSV